jgi:hypothetical protein
VQIRTVVPFAIIFVIVAFLVSAINGQDKTPAVDAGRFKVSRVHSVVWDMDFDFLLDTSTGAVQMRVRDKWLPLAASPLGKDTGAKVDRFQMIGAGDRASKLLVIGTASGKAWEAVIDEGLPYEPKGDSVKTSWTEVKQAGKN